MMLNRRDALRLGAAAAAGLSPGLTLSARAQETALSEYNHALGGSAVSVYPVSHASLALALPGTVAYVDPVGPAALYAGLPAPDLILITHEHGDHYNAETLAALAGDTTQLIANPAVYGMLPAGLKTRAQSLANGEGTNFAGLRIEAIPAYNTTSDRLNYHPKGRDNGYVLGLEGGRIYIAGDTEDIAEMRALTGIDIAFLPMNLPYTMDIEQAADAVAGFAPKTVYPYHYRGSDIPAFAALVAKSGVGTEVIQHDWYA